MDILNRMAGRITNYVKNIETGPCEVCEKSGFTEYRGNCVGLHWDLSYFPPTISGEPGSWNFSLYRHRKEIWYVARDGTIVEIIIAAYENLVSGEWKKKEKPWKEEG